MLNDNAKCDYFSFCFSSAFLRCCKAFIIRFGTVALVGEHVACQAEERSLATDVHGYHLAPRSSTRYVRDRRQTKIGRYLLYICQLCSDVINCVQSMSCSQYNQSSSYIS